MSCTTDLVANNPTDSMLSVSMPTLTDAILNQNGVLPGTDLPLEENRLRDLQAMQGNSMALMPEDHPQALLSLFQE
jgi:hypothetical protein